MCEKTLCCSVCLRCDLHVLVILWRTAHSFSWAGSAINEIENSRNDKLDRNHSALNHVTLIVRSTATFLLKQWDRTNWRNNSKQWILIITVRQTFGMKTNYIKQLAWILILKKKKNSVAPNPGTSSWFSKSRCNETKCSPMHVSNLFLNKNWSCALIRVNCFYKCLSLTPTKENMFGFFILLSLIFAKCTEHSPFWTYVHNEVLS